jgi:hypothetical protein
MWIISSSQWIRIAMQRGLWPSNQHENSCFTNLKVISHKSKVIVRIALMPHSSLYGSPPTSVCFLRSRWIDLHCGRSRHHRESTIYFRAIVSRGVKVSTFRCHVSLGRNVKHNDFFFFWTAKRGTQTKFLTFQCNFRENLTFRYVSLERNVKRKFFFYVG